MTLFIRKRKGGRELKSKQSQNAQVYRFMREQGRINALQAVNQLGCFRLASRIYDLKREGYNIATEIKSMSDGRHWAEYHLVRGRK